MCNLNKFGLTTEGNTDFRSLPIFDSTHLTRVVALAVPEIQLDQLQHLK